MEPCLWSAGFFSSSVRSADCTGHRCSSHIALASPCLQVQKSVVALWRNRKKGRREKKKKLLASVCWGVGPIKSDELLFWLLAAHAPTRPSSCIGCIEEQEEAHAHSSKKGRKRLGTAGLALTFSSCRLRFIIIFLLPFVCMYLLGRAENPFSHSSRTMVESYHKLRHFYRVSSSSSRLHLLTS